MAGDRSEKQLEYVRGLNQKVLDAKMAVQHRHVDFDRAWRYYHGDHTEGLALDDDQLLDWQTVNIILSNTETRIPVLLDAAPTWFVVSPDEDHDEAAQQVEKALQALAQEASLLRKYELVLRDQIVIGNGALKVWHDKSKGPDKWDVQGDKYVSSPAGEIAIDWVDPYSIFPDPAARNLEECEYLALASDVAGDRAKRLYDNFDPQKAEIIAFDNESKGGTGFLRAAQAWFASIFGGQGATGAGQRKMYRIWELYHEGGRKLTVFSGTNVLFDGDNPMPGNHFPIVMFRMYPTGYDFWSLSETLQVAGLQQSVDRDLYRVSAHARETSDTPWVISGAPGTVIPSGPGAILNLPNPEARAERVPPPPLPSYVFNLIEMKLDLLDKVTGVHDVNRGLRPGGVQSGIGIQQVLETALTRLRNLSRSNADQLGSLGQLVLEMMQANYGEDRTHAYHDGHSSARVTVGPDQLQRQIPMPAMDNAAGALGGDMGMGQPPDQTLSEPVEYRVVVQQGGDLPVNPMARAELVSRGATLMADDGRPMVDRQAWMEAVDLPNRKATLARMQQASMAQMQGQAAAMQQGGALPGQQQQMPPGMGPAGPSPQGAMSGGPGAPQMSPQDLSPGPPTPPQGTGAPVPAGSQGGMTGGGAGPAQQMIQLLQQYFTPDEVGMIEGLMAALEGQTAETPEQAAFLQALDPQKLEILRQVLAMAGVQLPDASGQPPPAGPPGLTMAP